MMTKQRLRIICENFMEHLVESIGDEAEAYEVMENVIGMSETEIDELSGLNEASRDPDDNGSPLFDFIDEEVPFRLKDVFYIPEDKITEELVSEIADTFKEDTDVMFDYDTIDGVIEDILVEWGLKPEEDEEQEEDGDKPF